MWLRRMPGGSAGRRALRSAGQAALRQQEHRAISSSAQDAASLMPLASQAALAMDCAQHN